MINRIQRERFESIESRLAAIESGAIKADETRYNVKEACAILKVSRVTLYTYIDAERLTKFKLAGKTYFNKDEIHKLAQTL